jgi:hypothetical protein
MKGLAMHCRSLLTGLFGSSLASLALAQTPPARAPAPAAPMPAAPAPTATMPAAPPPALPPPAAPPLAVQPPVAVSASAPVASGQATVAVDTYESVPATGQASRAGRFEGGLRTGLGFGLGKAGQISGVPGSREVNDIVAWRVPIWIDLGYRLSDPLTLGVYAQLGLGGGGDCGGSCNSSDLRLGAQALWHAPGGALWLGAGLGYEWQSLYALRVPPEAFPIDAADPDAVSQVATRVAETLGGPELTLQAGLDFELEPGLGVGPYVSASVGQYVTDSYDCDQVTCPTGSSVNGSATHAWLGVGVRGSYSP